MHEEFHAKNLSILLEIKPKRAEIGRPSRNSSKRTRIETGDQDVRDTATCFEKFIQENKD